MKGKKIDTEFVSQYISLCIIDGVPAMTDIIAEAKKEIAVIDAQIKEVETLKMTRSKLCDVVISLEDKKIKENKENEPLQLQFHQVSFSMALELVAAMEKNKSIILDGFHNVDTQLLKYTLKQLQELKVLISKDFNSFIPGKHYQQFKEFLTFNLSKEVQ